MTDPRTGAETVGGDQRSHAHEPAGTIEEGAEQHEEIEHPGKLLRIAGMVRAMLAELETASLDEPSRQRLTEIHNQMLDALRELLSGQLEAELSEFRLDIEGAPPSGAELRVVQAQLAGWLQGLFQGIQASIASQQLAAQHQLAQMRQQQLPGGEPGGTGSSDTGQYL